MQSTFKIIGVCFSMVERINSQINAELIMKKSKLRIKITDLSLQKKDIQIETLSQREATRITGGGAPGPGEEPHESCNGGWIPPADEY